VWYRYFSKYTNALSITVQYRYVYARLCVIVNTSVISDVHFWLGRANCLWLRCGLFVVGLIGIIQLLPNACLNDSVVRSRQLLLHRR
jgi:hypothetical protein